MRKIGLITALLLGSCGWAQAQPAAAGPPVIACNKNFQVSQAAVALTQIVGLVSGQGIYVCAIVANAGAATGTVQLEYGTGSNCGTGTQPLTPAFALGINGVLPVVNPYAFAFVPVGNALCLVTTGTGPIQLLLTYGQQ